MTNLNDSRINIAQIKIMCIVIKIFIIAVYRRLPPIVGGNNIESCQFKALGESTTATKQIDNGHTITTLYLYNNDVNILTSL